MEYLRAILFSILLLGEIIFLIRGLGFPAHLAPLIVILSNSLLLFIFAVLDLLIIGYYFCLAVFLISTLLSIFFLIKPKADTPVFFARENLPLFVFVLVLFSCFIYTRGTLFYSWDEFTHWGLIFKFITETRHLPIDTQVVSFTYPPLTAIWQFLTASFIQVAEDNATFAQMVLEYSLIIAIIPAPKQKRELNYFIFLLAVLLSIFLFELRLQRMAIDTMIALLFGAGLAQLPFKGKQSISQFIALTLVATSLVLTKPLSPVLSIVLIFAIIVHTLFSTPGIFKQKPTRSNSWRLILIVLSPLLFWFIWNLHVSGFKTFSDTSFTIKATTPVTISEKYPLSPNLYLKRLQLEYRESMKDVLLGKDVKLEVSLEAALKAFTADTTYFVKTVSSNFVNTFSEGDGITQGFTKGRIPQKFYLVLIIILTIINQKILSKHDKEKQNSHIIYSGSLTLGLILYSIGLYLAYIFVFVYEKNFAGVPAFERYYGTFLLPFWLFNIHTLYQTANVEGESRANSFIQWAGIFIIMGSFLFTPTTSIIHHPFSPEAQRTEVMGIYQKISKYPFSSTDKIYEVRIGDVLNGLEHYIMRYYLTPIASNNRGWSIRIKRDPENVTDFIFSPEEWFGLLKSQKYSYVLVAKSDARFWKEYGNLFDRHLADYDAPQLFLVTEDKLLFIPIEDQ